MKDIYLENVDIKDVDILFDWVNDIAVRKNAFNTQVIDYESHIKWFENKLKDQNAYIFICKYGEKNIGQIRVEIVDGVGTIDYSIDKKYRGLGYGKMILRLLEFKIDEICDYSVRLEGKVKHCNIPSQKAFERNGYVKINEEDYVVYYKNICR